MVNEKIMTDRSLIVLALDALDELNYSNSTESAEYQYYEATKLLRAALEQPQIEQEPVAWISPSALEWITRESEKVIKLTRKAQPEYDFTKPLYIHPQPPRQPLVAELQDAFFEGFCAVETYNDVRLNSVEEEWKKYKTVNRLKEQEC